MQYQTISQPGTLGLEQNKVLRNTYMMLSLTMAPTIMGAFIGASTNFSFTANISSGAMMGFCAMNEKLVDAPIKAPMIVGAIVRASIM